MKFVFSLILFSCSLSATAQNRGSLTFNELKNLAGNWAGTVVLTAESSQETFQTLLEIQDLKDSLRFNFNSTGEGEKQQAESFIMKIYDGGNKIRFDSSEYDVAAIRRRGVRLEIIIEREGVYESRSAEFQQSIVIGPANLNIVKKIRYSDMVDYFIRSRSAYTKK